MRAITSILSVTSLIALGSSNFSAAVLQGGHPPSDNDCESTTSLGDTTTCTASTDGGDTLAALAAEFQSGAVLAVSTDNPAVWAYLPETVSIEPGRTKTTYQALVAPDAPLGPVTITVSAYGKSRSAIIEIVP